MGIVFSRVNLLFTNVNIRKVPMFYGETSLFYTNDTFGDVSGFEMNGGRQSESIHKCKSLDGTSSHR